MNIKEKKKNIIQAGYKAVEELVKVAKEPIVDSDDDISADRLKNAAATKKLAIFDAFEILTRIQEEEAILNDEPLQKKETSTVLFYTFNIMPSTKYIVMYYNLISWLYVCITNYWN